MLGVWLQAVGNSKFILMKVTEEHVYWCRQCYSNMCRDNIADGRAGRKRGAETKDKEPGCEPVEKGQVGERGSPYRHCLYTKEGRLVSGLHESIWARKQGG